MKTFCCGLALVVCSWIGTVGVHAQQPDPRSFFPHHLGDVWEYTAYWFGIPQETYRSVVEADSIGADGRAYVYISNSPYYNYIIDTSDQVWSDRYDLGEIKVFDLTAKPGTRWTQGVNYYGTELFTRMDSMFNTVLFGKPTTVKIFRMWTKPASLDSTPWAAYYLASGFGEVVNTAEIGDVTILRGAIIGGVKYGTLSSVNAPEGVLPSTVKLFQNYPNPFNPATTIEFDLANDAIVRLEVLNLLGEEVATLAQSTEPAGRHKVVWNGRDRNGNPVSSGVYLYSLHVGQHTITRKLVLLR